MKIQTAYRLVVVLPPSPVAAPPREDAGRHGPQAGEEGGPAQDRGQGQGHPPQGQQAVRQAGAEEVGLPTDEGGEVKN